MSKREIECVEQHMFLMVENPGSDEHYKLILMLPLCCLMHASAGQASSKDRVELSVC